MTTRVKMITMAAGPAGNMHPGQVYALPDREAAALVAGRYAVPFDPALAARAAETPTPLAEGAAVETAAATPQRRGRGLGG